MDLKRVEVFKAGTFAGKGTYTEADLDHIAGTYNPVHRAAPLTLDHFDCGPAYGWVSRVWREGNSLYADIDGIDPSLAEDLKARKYEPRSIELFPELVEEGIEGFYLKAVTLLGGAAPAVPGMAPLQFSHQPTSAPYIILPYIGEKETHMKKTPQTEAPQMEAPEAPASAPAAITFDVKEFEAVKMALASETTKREEAEKALIAFKADEAQRSGIAKFEKAFDDAVNAGIAVPAEKAKLDELTDKISSEALDLLIQTFSTRQKVLEVAKGEKLEVKKIIIGDDPMNLEKSKAVFEFKHKHGGTYAEAALALTQGEK